MDENRSFVKSVLKGWIGAVLLTFMLMLILSLAMIKFELNDNIYKRFFTDLSLVFLL